MTEQSGGQSRRGKVYGKSKGHYFVLADGRLVDCSISSKLRKELIFSADNPDSAHSRVILVQDIRLVDPIAIGDDVMFTPNDGGGGTIFEILPRRNRFSRKASGPKPLEQVIAANVDQLVAVFSLARPEPAWNLLDRYLLSAEAAGLPAIVCLTKLDLAEDEAVMEELRVYERAGYRVFLTSAILPWGLEAFQSALRGRVSVYLGKSGVGKSTLINALQPGLRLRVGEVSAKSGKGRHTTTRLEMFDLDFGGCIIDTPGVREFSPWIAEDEDLAALFPEMRSLLGLCRFGAQCSHTHEPGCAVKDAVEKGLIHPRRYASYANLR